MTLWVIGIVVGVWILAATGLLISLCVMASRYNRSEPKGEDYTAYQEAMGEKRRADERAAKNLPHVAP